MTDTLAKVLIRATELVAENHRLQVENEKMRAELVEYNRNAIVDVTGSINYHSGYHEGVMAERERCAKVAEGFEANRDWVNGSLWGNIRKEVAAAIREQPDD